MNEPAPAKKRGRKPKAAVIAPQDENVATGPNEPVPYDWGVDMPQAVEDYPPEDPARGQKTPAVIRWNMRHRKSELAAIYRGWDFLAYLESNPPEYHPAE